MERRVKIIPGFEGTTENALCFRTGTGSLEDIPSEYGAIHKTALEVFYEQLVLGKEFPPELIISRTEDPQEMMVATFYVAPELAMTPLCPAFIYACSLWSRWGGPVASAHMMEDHFEVIADAMEIVRSSDHNPYARLSQAITLIETYLRTEVTPNPRHTPPLQVLGEEGPFIVVTSPDQGGDMMSPASWRQVYEQGYFCCIWVHRPGQIYILKKSSLVTAFDVGFGRKLLNEAEFGVPSQDVHSARGWYVSPDNNLILPPHTHPKTGDPLEGGTTLGWEEVLQILMKAAEKRDA